MKTENFYFDLPPRLIAQHPPSKRGTSRLMVVDRFSGQCLHSSIGELADFLPPGAVLVLNDSKVRHARLFAESLPGKRRTEFLFLEQKSPHLWRCLTRRSKGVHFLFPEGVEGEIVAQEGAVKEIRLSRQVDNLYFDRVGTLPLPPYIKREPDLRDQERYQSVFSSVVGSCAAPTAGLHFTDANIRKLEERGIQVLFITLHVGFGTFAPVVTEEVEEHAMHWESYQISAETACEIEKAKCEGRPVVAVGTTTVRTLESAWKGETLRQGEGRSNIFIYPGFAFRVVDHLLTNFHTPSSTLVMLVAAFAGQEIQKKAYQEAIKEEYRFFSYGDVMLIR